MRSSTIDSKEWLVYGRMNTGIVNAGTMCLSIYSNLSTMDYDVATCDGFWMNSKLIDIHEWCAYSRLWTGQGNNGLSSLIGDDPITVEHCLIATLSIHFDLN